MLNRRDLLLSGAATLLPALAFGADNSSPIATPSALLAQIMAKDSGNTGVVAGLCTAHDQRIVVSGSADAVNGRALDGNTIFGIASLTKLFTALALADMVVDGQMAMNDPLARYLPADVHVPTFMGKPITLLDVATYSSGLPGFPANLPPISATSFPHYSTDQLYKALAEFKLTSAPGTHYIYSNFGYGLLGLAVARRAGMDFESLIVSRICNPLGMDSTRIKLTKEMLERVSPGHNQKRDRIAGWDLPPAFQGAGAFRSTSNDLLRFLKAAMGIKHTALAPAFAEMMKTYRPADKPDTQVAAGWFITRDHHDQLIWKDGRMPGYTSFIGYSALHHEGVVILANGNVGLDGFGEHLLNAEFPIQG